MASQLSAIISAIAGISITADGITPTVFYGDTIKQSGDNYPMRVILPSDIDMPNRGARFANIGLGTVVVATWNISDLFLLRPIVTGSGLDQVADTLVLYAAAYVNALVGKQGLISGSRNITVDGFDVQIGGYQFPAGTDRWYYGVEARWTVKEIIG